ncbi:MAG: beta family protein [Klebsiella michiganensis]|uniref:beta family protein n=1 Tax=Klebsiella michiganensis TaxID=1134687 RepID=UPI00111A421C|nr:beta family protein [Klebsiella michiganensis]EMB3264145.1 beta family protein [Klebsiella michiganensis]MDU3964753.1 beta family protein [Klebsiella michiganensis]MDU4010415.1 beta family protein [Klebsiella michiganensis]
MEDISYVPILKTKRAEFTATAQLSKSVKVKIIPLFEIEPVPLDPDTDIPDKSYNEMLSDFGKKIATACSDISIIYLDGILVEEQFIDLGDIYPITNAVNQARAAGVHVIPVSSPTRNGNYLKAIDGLVKDEVCLRLTVTDIANPQMISAYISRLNIPCRNIDVVIDLRDSITEDSLGTDQSQTLAAGLINNLHNIHDFRRVILAAGSFPVDLSQISVGIYSQPRFEWFLWKDLRQKSYLTREVIYADYGIQHPDYTRLATRFPSVTASVRYTGDDDFWVFRGRKANQYGYDQYGAHSQQIVAHREYSGVTFSVADKDINDYALVYAQYLQNPSQSYKFGSPEVWRRIGQNHHITKVVYQLSSLYGL